MKSPEYSVRNNSFNPVRVIMARLFSSFVRNTQRFRHINNATNIPSRCFLSCPSMLTLFRAVDHSNKNIIIFQNVVCILFQVFLIVFTRTLDCSKNVCVPLSIAALTIPSCMFLTTPVCLFEL